RVEAVALHSLASERAARARFPARSPAHGPYCFEKRLLTANRIEALDVDRDPVGRIEFHERCGRHVPCAEQHGEVAGDGARDAVAYRRDPAIEFLNLDEVRCDLDQELWLVDRS